MKNFLRGVVLLVCLSHAHAKIMTWDIIQYPEDVESIVINGNVSILMDGRKIG